MTLSAWIMIRRCLIAFALLWCVQASAQTTGRVAIVLLGGLSDTAYLHQTADGAMQELRESTWGQLDLSYEIYAFKESFSCSGISFGVGDQIMRNHGLNPDDYYRIEFINPYSSQCRFGGLAEWTGKHILLNGGAAVSMHEVGHTLSLTHGADMTDPMGWAYSPPFPHWSALNKARIQKFIEAGSPVWPGTQVENDSNPDWMIDVTIGQVVSLGPLEYPSNLPAAAKLPLGDGRYLYIEHRTGWGTDVSVERGVYITEGPTVIPDDFYANTDGSTGLGMVGEVGQQWQDCSRQLAVSLLSMDAYQATVSITPFVCPPPPPPIPPPAKCRGKKCRP